MTAKIINFIALASWLVITGSCMKSCEGDAKDKKGVLFENLQDNQEITSPVMVKFTVVGMTVRPAMEDVHDKTSGHHHILIDHPLGFIEKGQAIPTDPRHIHYGKGETSATVALPLGTHTLSLQFGDGAHLSYGKEMAKTITVKVIQAEDTDDAAKREEEEAAPADAIN